jgi:hypothetical protein
MRGVPAQGWFGLKVTEKGMIMTAGRKCFLSEFPLSYSCASQQVMKF